MLLILLLYKTASSQSSLRASLDFSCISPWPFLFHTGEFILPDLQPSLLLSMDLSPTSYFLFALWDQNGTYYWQGHPKVLSNLNHPVNPCGCNRDICSSTVTFSALFSTSSQFPMFDFIHSDSGCGFMQMSWKVPCCMAWEGLGHVYVPFPSTSWTGWDDFPQFPVTDCLLLSGSCAAHAMEP